jgi:hypothetical protein
MCLLRKIILNDMTGPVEEKFLTSCVNLLRDVVLNMHYTIETLQESSCLHVHKLDRVQIS